MPDRILIIGADDDACGLYADALAQDHPLSFAPNVLEAGKRLQAESCALVVFDHRDERAEIADILATIRQLAPEAPLIVVGAAREPRAIVEAAKAGAADYVVKPVVAEKLRLAAARALETRSLKGEIDYLRRGQDVIYDRAQIIAVSPAMQQAMAAAEKLSRTDSTVLITGETGTGKSFISGNIHFNSPRRHKPFVKVNCANIPETLLESELFGHEKGAFTGADKARTGRFEQAHGGTLFLDEFCEMTPGLQSKLLRVLEEKAFERLGGNKTIRADVRIIAATNRDIEGLVARGGFREDLYYRINVLRIHIPPLRERREDIEPLAVYLLAKHARALKKKSEGFAPEALDLLQRYSWPGNIRQLSNVIERALLIEERPRIHPESLALPELERRASPPPAPPPGLKLSLEREREIICQALEENLWIQKDAARQLGISPRALNYRVKKLGIAHARWRRNK
jgi:DNA-binding NtrC family response regulator